MAAGLALLGVFAVVERRRHGTPMIAPSLLRNRAFTSGLLVGLAFFAGFAGLVMVASLFLQLGLRFSPEHAGLTLVPLSLGTAVTRGRLVRADAALRPQGPAGRGARRRRRRCVGARAGRSTHGGARRHEPGARAGDCWSSASASGFVFGPLFNVILAGRRRRGGRLGVRAR